LKYAEITSTLYIGADGGEQQDTRLRREDAMKTWVKREVQPALGT
jgi:hypothetical protein